MASVPNQSSDDPNFTNHEVLVHNYNAFQKRITEMKLRAQAMGASEEDIAQLAQ